MSPPPRGGVALAALAVAALVVRRCRSAVLLALALVAAAAVDALAGRTPPDVERHAPRIVARGVPAPLALEAAPGRERFACASRVPPELRVEPAQAVGGLDGAARRPAAAAGTCCPPPATASTARSGSRRWTRAVGERRELLVYPDLPDARRLARAVRAGAFRDEGLRRRGPLGLGTEFESVRDYLPDDDVRQINWRATRGWAGPMSNQYRVERDRDVVCVVDCGRLMAAPLGDRTRLDAALDAAVAVAAVADELGDRVRRDRVRRRGPARRSPPRRRGARAVARRSSTSSRAASTATTSWRSRRRRRRSARSSSCSPTCSRSPRRGRSSRRCPCSRGATPSPSRASPTPTWSGARAASRTSASTSTAPAVALDVLAPERAPRRAAAARGRRGRRGAAGDSSAACVRSYLRAKARALL